MNSLFWKDYMSFTRFCFLFQLQKKKKKKKKKIQKKKKQQQQQKTIFKERSQFSKMDSS